MQFQGKYCPLLLTASLLSGLTQFISQIQIIISISLLLPFQSVTQTLLHYLTSQTAKHSTEILSCAWDESWLLWCWGGPWALSTLRCKALLIPHGMQHKSSGSLKMCQLEVAQHGAWKGETGSFCTGANTLRGQAQCWGSWDQPLGSAAAQFLHPLPATLPGASPAVFWSFALQKI